MTGQEVEPLRAALNEPSVQGVADWLLAASEKERRAMFPAVVARLEASGWLSWENHRPLISAYGLAVLGCAPTAAKALLALRNGLLISNWGRIVTPQLVEVLSKRDIRWLPTLATTLASRRESVRWHENWKLADTFVRLSGIPTPTSEVFTLAWTNMVRWCADADRELRDGPYTTDLLPMLFEYDRLGSELARPQNGHDFNQALIRLSEQDPAVRAQILNGCLARLSRGGRVSDLRAYVTLHDMLAPTSAENVEYVADYIGLLNAQLSTVATLAQRALREMDEAGLLDPDTLLESSVVTLERPEKALVKAQTTWLRQAAKRHPARAAELLGLLEPAPDPEPIVPVALPPKAAIPLAPPPIASVQEWAALLLTGHEAERFVAGLVELSYRDRPALERVVHAHMAAYPRAYYGGYGLPTTGCLYALLGGNATVLEAWGPTIEETQRKLREIPLQGRSSGLSELWGRRYAEILQYGKSHPVPMLISMPTRANGHIDPDVLLERLELAERAGWHPWPLDLTQAALRLPRQIDPSLMDRADLLTSEAGKWVAAYMRRGHRDPVVERVAHRTKRHDGYPLYRVWVSLKPAGPVQPVEELLFTQTGGSGDSSGWLCGLLPSHGEVVAAWTMRDFAALAGEGRGAAALLPQLADGDGPVGVATTLAIAYGLSARDLTDRVATIDAIFAFGDRLDGTAIGVELADLAVNDTVIVSRVAASLGEAARAGIVETVWAICRSMLPALLTMDKPRPGTADVVDVAIECVRSLNVRGAIAEVASVAGRGGSGRLVQACRKLDQLLT